MMRRAPLPVLLLTLLTLNTLPAGQAAPPLRLIVEAEDFQPTAGDWAAKDWGTNYYAATFAISFLSRGRYLSAPEQGAPSAAEKEIDVPRDGTFEVWARFEQPYNYAVEFDVEIRQGGQTVFQRGYGRLDAPKLWPFKKGLQPQVLWEWGGTDNIVWEGKDTKAALKKGKATLVLKKGPQKAAQAARRNVDAILLTDDAAGVEKQIKQASYLPLDGWFTQAGDVFLKVTNPADAAAPLAAHVGPCTEHSPYWVHVRDWPHQIWIGKTEGAEAPKPDGYLKPGAASPWVEVGRFLDTLNQSQWRVFPVAADKQPLAGKKVHLALGLAGPDGQPRVLREGDFTVGTDGAVTFFLDGDLRRTRRVRTVEEDLEQLARVVQAFPKKGKRPEQFLIDGIMGSASGVEQSPRVKELCRDIALALGSNTLPEVPRPERNASIDVRSIPTKDLAAYCQKLVKEGKADRLKVVSLGDEIHIGGEAQSPRDDPAFRAYLRERNADPADLGLKTLDEARLELKDKQSLLYYASQVFSFEQGLKAYKERTDVLEANLPKGIYCGANYSPHPYYWPREGQWIRAFARRALTLPWAEDYTWQIPEASQQINGYLLTALRAAAKYHDLPIQMYVMPHAPGQTPADLRRAWYTALGHGAKQLNFFCATPLSVAYTENYVVSEAADTWRTIHDLVHETGQAEEVLFPAQPRPAEVGLLISFAQDLWDPEPAYNHERKCVYLALRQLGYAVDFVTEEDLQKGRRKDLKTIFVIGNHLEAATARALRRWVQAGGQVAAHAGGGFFDEHNRPMDLLNEVFGITEQKVERKASVIMSKEQLPRMEPLDTIDWEYQKKKVKIPVLGFKQTMKVGPQTRVYGKYASDGSPAMVIHSYGRGAAFLFGTFVGSAYVRSGIPIRPVDRGATQDSFAHFLPSKFDDDLVDIVTAACGDVRWDVITDNPMVETVVLEGPKGLAVACINWTPTPQKVMLSVQYLPKNIQKATSIAHGLLPSQRRGVVMDFRLQVDVADMVILE